MVRIRSEESDGAQQGERPPSFVSTPFSRNLALGPEDHMRSFDLSNLPTTGELPWEWETTNP
jgi:hypothetical protein